MLITKRQIIGDEGSLDDLFDDEVPAAADFQAGFSEDLWLAKIQRIGALGKANQDIEFRNSGRGGLQFREHARERIDQAFIKVFLAA